MFCHQTLNGLHLSRSYGALLLRRSHRIRIELLKGWVVMKRVLRLYSQPYCSKGKLRGGANSGREGLSRDPGFCCAEVESLQESVACEFLFL